MLGQYKFRKPSGYERVYVEAGMWQPLDNLSETVNPSVNFGFWFRTKTNEKEMIEFGFNFTVPDSNLPYEFKADGTVYRNRATGLFGMVGVRYGRSYPLSADGKRSVEIFPSLGAAFFGQRTISVENSPGIEGEERSPRSLGTVHVGQGVRLNFRNIGIQAQYQFTPYALNPHIPKNFGAQSLTFGIVYRQ